MRNDQIFTPAPIVSKMLDEIGYLGDGIKTNTIFEPSFGEGAFLIQIAQRIFEYSRTNHLTSKETVSILNNVHGVELDEELHTKTVAMLTDMAKNNGINYNWPNLICADTTTLDATKKYDMCIGNPPLSINQQLCNKDRYTSVNHKKQLHTHLYCGGVVVS